MAIRVETPDWYGHRPGLRSKPCPRTSLLPTTPRRQGNRQRWAFHHDLIVTTFRGEHLDARGLKVSAHQYCRRRANTVGDAAVRSLCHASPQSVKRSVRPRNSAWPITSPTAPCPLTRWHVAREVRRAPPFGSCGPPQCSTKIDPGNRWPPLGRARQRPSGGWSWRMRRRMRMLDFSRNSDHLHRLYTTHHGGHTT